MLNTYTFGKESFAANLFLLVLSILLFQICVSVCTKIQGGINMSLEFHKIQITEDSEVSDFYFFKELLSSSDSNKTL